jgi:hypothetical protein
MVCTLLSVPGLYICTCVCVPYGIFYDLTRVHVQVQLGSVAFLPAPKIKSLGKYLFSRHPKHTIGICSLRYIQIQGGQDIV